jgi:hypothetical protein
MKPYRNDLTMFDKTIKHLFTIISVYFRFKYASSFSKASGILLRP